MIWTLCLFLCYDFFESFFTLFYGYFTAVSYEEDTLDKAGSTSLIEFGIRLTYRKAYSILIFPNGFVSDLLLFIQKKVRLLWFASILLFFRINWYDYIDIYVLLIRK